MTKDDDGMSISALICCRWPNGHQNARLWWLTGPLPGHLPGATDLETGPSLSKSLGVWCATRNVDPELANTEADGRLRYQGEP
jgi:hypothetical protein